MIETYYAGAYWGPRKESAEECARRAQSLLLTLARTDAFFARWFVPPRSRKEVPRPFDLDLASLQELFAQNRTQNDEGRALEDLGFHVTADNGARPGKHQGDHAYLRMLCGAYIEPVGNACVLNLPSTGPHREQVLTGPMLAKVLRAMALAWEPDWAVATSHDHREMTTERGMTGTFVGWVMYLSRRRGSVPPLPEPVRVEPVEDLGTIVTLTPERFTASNSTHVELAARVHHVLEGSGLLVPVNPLPAKSV